MSTLLPSFEFCPSKYSCTRLNEVGENPIVNARFRNDLSTKQIQSSYVNEFNRIKSVLENHVLKDADLDQLRHIMSELEDLSTRATSAKHF